jgi:6-phosphogluconate dehydrogenase (decarboxylating)
MQRGMIGWGWIGANTIRRLIDGGHKCVVFEMFPKAVGALVKEEAIGQASTFGWERYVGDAGCIIGIETFGASGPLKELQKESA